MPCLTAVSVGQGVLLLSDAAQISPIGTPCHFAYAAATPPIGDKIFAISPLGCRACGKSFKPQSLVLGVFKRKPFSGHGLTGESAIFAVNNILHCRGRYFALAYFYERANDYPYHII